MLACQFPPESSRQASVRAQGRVEMLVPVLCCHQTQSREVIWVRLARELHPSSADFSQSTPLGQARMGQPHSLPYRNL